MKLSFSLRCGTFLIIPVFALVAPFRSAFAQHDSNPYLEAAQLKINAIMGDPTITDKDEAILDAMEAMIEESPAEDAPAITRAFVEANDLDYQDALFSRLVFLASTLVPDRSFAIGDAAAVATGYSQNAQNTAAHVVSQATGYAASGDSVNALSINALSVNQQSSMAGYFITISDGSLVIPGWLLEGGWFRSGGWLQLERGVVIRVSEANLIYVIPIEVP